MDKTDAAHNKRPASWLFKALLLLALGTGLYLLLPRSLELNRLPGILASVEPLFLGLFLTLLLSSNVLRALRLRIILQSGQTLLRTFHVCNIGFMANSILPLRAGEFCMAALLAGELPGGGGEALSKILADRLLDLVSVAIFFLGALVLLIPPNHAAQREMHAALATAASLGGVFALLLAALALESSLVRLVQAMGRGLGLNAEGLAAALRAGLEGLRSLFRKRVFSLALLLSLAIWLVVATSFFTGMLMFGLPPQFACAILAMCFTVAGLVAFPAPAGVGTTHGAIVIALMLFGVEIESALAFAIAYHALATGLNITLGLLGLKALRLDLADLRRIVATGRGRPPQ